MVIVVETGAIVKKVKCCNQLVGTARRQALSRGQSTVTGCDAGVPDGRRKRRYKNVANII